MKTPAVTFLAVSQYRLYYPSGNQILGDVGGGFAFLSLFPVRSHLGAQCHCPIDSRGGVDLHDDDELYIYISQQAALMC